MNQRQTQAISRAGLGEAFEADKSCESNRILEAKLLREQLEADEAVYRFAEAEQSEVSLGQGFTLLRLIAKSFLHRFSALNLWVQAAPFIRRLRLATNCSYLLRYPNVCASGFRHTPIHFAFDALIGMKNWR